MNTVENITEKLFQNVNPHVYFQGPNGEKNALRKEAVV